jgi:hypothetical protein
MAVQERAQVAVELAAVVCPLELAWAQVLERAVPGLAVVVCPLERAWVRAQVLGREQERVGDFVHRVPYIRLGFVAYFGLH